jgi:hypothetical protein
MNRHLSILSAISLARQTAAVRVRRRNASIISARTADAARTRHPVSDLFLRPHRAGGRRSRAPRPVVGVKPRLVRFGKI